MKHHTVTRWVSIGLAALLLAPLASQANSSLAVEMGCYNCHGAYPRGDAPGSSACRPSMPSVGVMQRPSSMPSRSCCAVNRCSAFRSMSTSARKRPSGWSIAKARNNAGSGAGVAQCPACHLEYGVTVPTS